MLFDEMKLCRNFVSNVITFKLTHFRTWLATAHKQQIAILNIVSAN